jgi:hypothetical protein
MHRWEEQSLRVLTAVFFSHQRPNGVVSVTPVFLIRFWAILLLKLG